MSDIMLQTTTYANPVFQSSLAGSHVFLQNAKALGAWSTLSSTSGGSTITFMSISDSANQVVSGPMAGGSGAPFIVRGGLSTPDIDFDVQNQAASLNLLLVHENGTVEAPSGGIISSGPMIAAGSNVCTVANGLCSAGGGPVDIQITTGVGVLAAHACTAPTAATMTGLLATSAIIGPTPTTSTTGVTGWDAANPALAFNFYVQANTFNWWYCNGSVSPVTPGGSVTWNVGAR